MVRVGSDQAEVESDEILVGLKEVVGRSDAFGFQLKEAGVEGAAFGIQSDASKVESDEAQVGPKQAGGGLKMLGVESDEVGFQS